MKYLLTECTKRAVSRIYFERLESLYSSIPATRCLGSDCHRQCCSKLKGTIPGQGASTSLPLVYSIEYWNIDKYLRENFGPGELERFYPTERDEQLCVFFDEEASLCGIYHARPLSCRLFGLRLPNMLWGIDCDDGATDAVFCKEVEVLNSEKYEKFLDQYKSYWDLIALWSVDNPVLTVEQGRILKKQIGFDNIYLLGWVEFNLLRSASPAWLERNINKFWEDHGNSL